MEAIQKRAEKQANIHVKSIPASVDELAAYIASAFGHTESQLREKWADQQLGSSGGSELAQLVGQVESKLTQAITMLTDIERWVGLSEPVVEDGNNFGVEVQSYVLKSAQERRKALIEHADALCKFHKDRGDLVEKVAPKTTTKKTVSNGESEQTGGKAEESGKKTSASVTNTDETTQSPPSADALQAICAYDVRWYNYLRRVTVEVMDSLAIICDKVTKNETKLLKPRGGGSGGRTMYDY